MFTEIYDYIANLNSQQVKEVVGLVSAVLLAMGIAARTAKAVFRDRTTPQQRDLFNYLLSALSSGNVPLTIEPSTSQVHSLEQNEGYYVLAINIDPWYNRSIFVNKDEVTYRLSARQRKQVFKAARNAYRRVENENAAVAMISAANALKRL